MKEKTKNRTSKNNDDMILSTMLELSYCKGKNDLYTTIHYQNRKKSVSVTSKTYLDYITAKVYSASGTIIQDSDILKRLKLISFALDDEAVEDSELFPKRYAYLDGDIYIDMANDRLQYIKVTENGFQICEPENDLPLFEGNVFELPIEFSEDYSETDDFADSDELLSDLDSVLNLCEDDKLLFKIWLISCMNPNINPPILYLIGGAGSGKSTMQNLIVELLDPSKRGLINWDDTNNKDLGIMLNKSFLLNFDNVSKITEKKSDLLCHTVTGGELSTRKLYTDNEEVNYNLRTRITISSVEDCIAREDLATRTLFLNLPQIERGKRISEDNFPSRYHSIKNKIFGQMLEILSLALARYPEWQKTHQSHHRLASFELFASLVADILDEENGYKRFRRIMKEKHIEQAFYDTGDSWFMSCLFQTLELECDNEFSGSTKKLYGIIADWITDSPDSKYNNEAIISYDRFAKMLHKYQDIFPEAGYDIEFSRLRKENISAVSIKKLEENDIQ